MDGWIKIHRKLLDDSIWQISTSEQKVILITLLLIVNHQEREWEWKGQKFSCQPGQVITSLSKIAEIAGKDVSIQNVRTALLRFEKLKFLTNESTKHNRLITICNWNKYQLNESEANKDANSQLTNDQQTPNKRLTTNKNVKKEKNVKNNILSFENFWNSYHQITGMSKTDKDAAAKYWRKLTESERKKAMENIQAYSDSNDPKFRKKCRTYLSDKNFNDEFKEQKNETETYTIPD